jgi:hypothetical protein
MRFGDVITPRLAPALRGVATLVIALGLAHPIGAQGNNMSSVSVTFGGFSTPTGVDFAATEIRGTVTYTITCDANRTKCLLTMAGVTAAVSEPANTTALTNFQYSFDNGASWTTLTTASVTVNPGAGAGVTSGSFLVRYRLGWSSGGNPYTPPGSYGFPVVFTLKQGNP